jgi:hypothetical protein
MISKRAAKLQKLCEGASAPNCDADRLTAISRAANRDDLGRPTRSFMVEQLREIESRNTDKAVTLRIAEIRDRFSHNKGVKERRLERRARTKIEMMNDSIVEPETIEATEPAPAQRSMADDDPQPAYPPRTLLFPPPPEVYELGSIDMQSVARRMVEGGARDLHEAPGRQDINQAIIRIGLGLPQCIEVTEGICRTTWLALQYERSSVDPRMPGDHWPRHKLFAAIFYFANSKFGFGKLPDAPPSVACIRELIEQAPQSAYVRLEQLPRAIAAVKHYRQLPGFEDLLKEIEGAQR